jgi:hypothetical protein
MRITVTDPQHRTWGNERYAHLRINRLADPDSDTMKQHALVLNADAQ